MYSADQVDALIEQWRKEGLSKPELVIKIANACIGWAYVWGSLGQLCTTSIRKTYMNSTNISSGDINLIKKRCQILSGAKGSCDGCPYYPNGKQTRVFDCRGFTRWILSKVGIALAGGGATSQWNAASNWAAKGTIDTLPKDKVCCIFRDVNGTKEHTLFYDGQGHYIHCSGEVKKQDISTYKATHWAIPKGLYDNVTPTPAPTPSETIPKGKAKVTGKSVALRLGPTTSAGILTRIATNQYVNIAEVPTTWSYVDYNGKKGYMMNQYLHKDDNTTATVTGKKLALRQGPTTQAAIITRVDTNQKVKYATAPTDWLYVSYGNKVGYMMRQYLKEG